MEARREAYRPSAFRAALERSQDITLIVRDRHSGHHIHVTLWFTHDANTLYLLPAEGSRTDWFQHVQADRQVTVRAGDEYLTAKAVPIIDPAQARAIRASLIEKYGEAIVARYYHEADAVVLVPLVSAS